MKIKENQRSECFYLCSGGDSHFAFYVPLHFIVSITIYILCFAKALTQMKRRYQSVESGRKVHGVIRGFFLIVKIEISWYEKEMTHLELNIYELLNLLSEMCTFAVSRTEHTGGLSSRELHPSTKQVINITVRIDISTQLWHIFILS